VYAADGPSTSAPRLKAYFWLNSRGYGADHPAVARASAKVGRGGVTDVNTSPKSICASSPVRLRPVPAFRLEIVFVCVPQLSVLVQHLRDFGVSRANTCFPFHLLTKEPFKKIPSTGEWSSRNGSSAGWKTPASPALEQETGSFLANFYLSVLIACALFELRPRSTPAPIALKVPRSGWLERLNEANGLGAIYPSMTNAIIALRLPGIFARRSSGAFLSWMNLEAGIEEGDKFPHAAALHSARMDTSVCDVRAG